MGLDQMFRQLVMVWYDSSHFVNTWPSYADRLFEIDICPTYDWLIDWFMID